MNKIQWLEWAQETFEKARSTGKPILLDITGSWCHWCHVMDKTSYSDPSVIDMINRNFIPVRVDTDRRPDVNRRYNMGGWPTTAFLDSDGKVITGGTYIPPQQLREVLRSVLDHYSKNRGKVGSRLEPTRLPRATEDPLSVRTTKDIATSIAVNFDIDYGGFGFEPKFPHTDALEYALLRYRYHGEREMLTVVTRTLDKMGKGGIYDSVEDGFFRYSTTRDWSVPHFEKMAEDNAKLLAVYLRALQATGSVFYRQLAEGIVAYVEARLTDPDRGGFYGSQDADEEYYKLGLDARRKVIPPRVDKTFYANYNAHFVSSFLLAGVLLDRPGLAKFALTSLDKLLGQASEDEGLPHFWNGEKSGLRGLLVDHASVLQALLDAYEYSGKEYYVRRAARIADYSLKTLYDEKKWGFFDIPESPIQLGELRVRDKPLDENSVMASALTRLSHVTGEEKYRDVAERSLRLFAADYERYGIMAAAYALALEAHVSGPVTITIVGPRSTEGFEKFRLEALRTFASRRSMLYLDTSRDQGRIEKLGYKADDSATAYVCVGKTCGPPLKDPSQIEASLLSLLQQNATITGT